MRRPFLILLIALSLLIGNWAIRSFSIKSVATPAPAAAVERSSDSYMVQMEERLKRNPDDTHAYAQLGLAFLQQVRETGDPLLYTQAQHAFDEALTREPKQVDALMGQGILALARHDFVAALDWAEQAWAINPFRAQILGIMVDAQVELGRYEEAVDTLQRMVDLRPDLHSYSRISYVRELHGDVNGAITAMQTAVDSGVPGTEEMLWSQIQLGHLYFNHGNLTKAETIYREALYFRADYLPAQAALARIQATNQDITGAIAIYEQVVQRLPLPEYVIMLGELYERAGDMKKAQQQYELVQIMQQLNAQAGMDVDLEMAYYNIEYGNDLATAEEQARAVYQRRAMIHSADTLAWALYKNGKIEEAKKYSEESLQLGTQDAQLFYHAGMIAYELGEWSLARQHLQQTLAINPFFSLRHAPIVNQTLAILGPNPTYHIQPR